MSEHVDLAAYTVKCPFCRILFMPEQIWREGKVLSGRIPSHYIHRVCPGSKKVSQVRRIASKRTEERIPH